MERFEWLGVVGIPSGDACRDAPAKPKLAAYIIPIIPQTVCLYALLRQGSNILSVVNHVGAFSSGKSEC